MVVFRTDPCGIICLFITYLSLFYADYVVIRHLIIPSLSDTLWGVFNVLVFNLIVCLIVACHLRAVLSDPGIVPLPKTCIDFSDMHAGNKKPEKKGDWTVCMKCETYRPPRAHHCRICERCIRRMDHHCPWINNCVGEFNQKFFLQFLLYVGLASIYAIGLVIGCWVKDHKLQKDFKHTRVVHSIILVTESILFGLFVIAIGCDQMSAILNDETAIEHLQQKGFTKPKRPARILLSEVFGRGSSLKWIFPTEFRPIPVEEDVYSV